jgi:hypothetical protein
MYIVKLLSGSLIAKDLTRDEAFELAREVANKYHTFAYVYREDTLVAIYS